MDYYATETKKLVPTLRDNKDGTGKYYAWWSKPSGERQMPDDLTYKWNLINKTNLQAKYSRDIEIDNKLTVTRGEGRGK